jgi:hypothetical protein
MGVYRRRVAEYGPCFLKVVNPQGSELHLMPPW